MLCLVLEIELQQGSLCSPSELFYVCCGFGFLAVTWNVHLQFVFFAAMKVTKFVGCMRVKVLHFLREEIFIR